MIVRVQARLDRIDVDLSAERLVERLLQTNNIDSHSGEGDFTSRRAEYDSAPAERVVRLSLPAKLKRTGKEMKFVVHGDGDERTADPSLVRLIVRADRLRRLAENPGWTLEDVASQQNMGGPYAARLIRLNYLAVLALGRSQPRLQLPVLLAKPLNLANQSANQPNQFGQAHILKRIDRAGTHPRLESSLH